MFLLCDSIHELIQLFFFFILNFILIVAQWKREEPPLYIEMEK